MFEHPIFTTKEEAINFITNAFKNNELRFQNYLQVRFTSYQLFWFTSKKRNEVLEDYACECWNEAKEIVSENLTEWVKACE